jgi:hypothetical protein
MSIPKKKSRKILVHGVEYVWLVRDNGDYKTIVVQMEDEGQLLYSSLSSWDTPENWNGPITPVIVRKLIERSLKEGWEPEAKNQKPYKQKIYDRYFKN